MLYGIIMHINIMDSAGAMVDTQIIAAKEDTIRNVEEIGKEAPVAASTGIYT